MGGVPLILESLVDFEREISVIAVRGIDGARAAYDPAENIHRDGILHTSTVPAGISPETAEAARKSAFAILEALNYVGVIGVEFFVTADGSLLVNEIAPRVHNSGHWTEAACAVSQFEQHIRAICGLPLGDTARHSDCVMENLIGDDIRRAPALLAEPDLVLHLYGKAEARPGRKMGHFTRLPAQRFLTTSIARPAPGSSCRPPRNSDRRSSCSVRASVRLGQALGHEHRIDRSALAVDVDELRIRRRGKRSRRAARSEAASCRPRSSDRRLDDLAVGLVELGVGCLVVGVGAACSCPSGSRRSGRIPGPMRPARQAIVDDRKHGKDIGRILVLR